VNFVRFQTVQECAKKAKVMKENQLVEEENRPVQTDEASAAPTTPLTPEQK